MDGVVESGSKREREGSGDEQSSTRRRLLYLAQQIHTVFSAETETAGTIGEPFDYEGVWDTDEIM